jgi:DNA-binding NarL/FixJ family response regulator
VNRPISVVLADDHALVRSMLRKQLDDEQDIRVVAVANDADEAAAAAARLSPDVVVMDIDMPGTSCFEAARTIRRTSPGTQVLFLSAFFNDAYIDQALAVAAAGFLTKSEPPESVTAAIRTAHAGGRHFSAEVKTRIVLEQDGPRLCGAARSRAATLSDRELEVLRYIARGLSQKQIARLIHRSEGTIHKHSKNIMAKLAIHDRVELARFAIREGLAEA